MTFTAADLEAALCAALPAPHLAPGLAASLVYVEGSAKEQGGDLWATFQLFLCGVDAVGALEVVDIYEQDARVAAAAHLGEPDRVQAYVEGWGAAVGETLSALTLERARGVLPMQLVCPDALGLARAETSADFTAACLKPGRLGALMASGGG
jgi:hypothetical protein